MKADQADVVVIGSGMGRATFAAGLAPSGARIIILERGERLVDSPHARDPRAIFQRGHFRPQETWRDAAGVPFNPGNYYYVGGNTKFYGAVLMRYRAEDFRPISYADGEDSWLAHPLRAARTLVQSGRNALSGARAARRGYDGAAAFDSLSIHAGAG